MDLIQKFLSTLNSIFFIFVFRFFVVFFFIYFIVFLQNMVSDKVAVEDHRKLFKKAPPSTILLVSLQLDEHFAFYKTCQEKQNKKKKKKKKKKKNNYYKTRL